MYGDTAKKGELAVSLALTVVNALVAILIVQLAHEGLPTLALGTILTYVLVGIAGYVGGRSGSIRIAVAELIFIASLAVVLDTRSMSREFIRELFTLYLLVYSITFLIGSSFFKSLRIPRGIGKSYRSLSSNVFIALAGLLGFTIINTSLLYYGLKYLGIPLTLKLGLLHVVLPLINVKPLNDSATILYVFTIVATFFLIALTNADRALSSPGLVYVWSAVLTFIPLSLPLALTLIDVRGGEPVAAGEGVVLGRVIKVLSKGRWRKAPGKVLEVPFKHGENNHIVIVGASGSGKSMLGKAIVKQVAEKLGGAILIIDTHGEYRGISGAKVFTPVENPVNILDRLDKEPSVRAKEVADLIASSFRLGNIQRSALQKIVLELYRRVDNPTLDSLEEALTKAIVGSSSGAKDSLEFARDVYRSLIPYIRMLRFKREVTYWVRPEDLISGVSVIDLSVIESESLSRVYVETALEMLFYAVKRYGGTVLLVVEEAHRYLGKGRRSTLARMLCEGRKFGVAVVVISQDPLRLDTSALTNAKVVISFSLAEATGASYIAKVVSGGVQSMFRLIREELPRLPNFEALAWLRGNNVVYHIKTYILNRYYV
ncbi:MAG: hypothetical protein B6U73_00595 [Desulfurococcales archaeon ex4484_204]|nr:MAG: hypothetical protein B6U73_00595 [Desulfurococcales archaeon ex4484_204]